MARHHIRSIAIDGFRPFRKFQAELGVLQVIAGANGSGKTSLFEFLRFLRDAATRELPSEILSGTIGQELFHHPGPDKFSWNLTLEDRGQGHTDAFNLEGEIAGPFGGVRVARESVTLIESTSSPSKSRELLLNVTAGKGTIRYLGDHGWEEDRVALRRPNSFALLTSVSDKQIHLSLVRLQIQAWEFHSSSSIDADKLREPAVIDEQPRLFRTGSNLAAVLHYLQIEHRDVFDELLVHLRGLVPGFRSLSIKTRSPGRVGISWEEDGLDQPLTQADLSDGTVRLLCWLCIALAPNSPPLVCIDEPDQGVHPRTLPVLAALFQKLSERTQVLLTTHSSYFLRQFDLEQIAVMHKENGRAVFAKPKDSATLKAILADFGSEEIEALHRSDELEDFA